MKSLNNMVFKNEQDKLDYVESYFAKFDYGGEVFLSKDYWAEGIAIIYVNRPEKKNALNGKMIVDFHKCIRELETSETIKGVILTSKGSNFCSGGDLEFVKSIGTEADGRYMSWYMHKALTKFRNLPVVTVSLVHGVTLGGGSELSVYSDYILAAEDVKLGFVHGKMGITTAWGGTTRLLQILGKQKTMELLLSSKVYNAEECVKIGLVYKIVDTEKKLEETLNFIRQLLVHDKSIIFAFKKIINNTLSNDLERLLAYEREIFAPTWGCELNKEALAKKVKHVNNK